MTKPNKPVYFYIAKWPDGEHLLHTLSDNKIETIDKAVEFCCGEPWKSMYRHGYRIVKVELREVTK